MRINVMWTSFRHENLFYQKNLPQAQWKLRLWSSLQFDLHLQLLQYNCERNVDTTNIIWLFHILCYYNIIHYDVLFIPYCIVFIFLSEKFQSSYYSCLKTIAIYRLTNYWCIIFYLSLLWFTFNHYI